MQVIYIDFETTIRHRAPISKACEQTITAVVWSGIDASPLTLYQIKCSKYFWFILY